MFTETRTKTFLSSVALAAHRRVKLDNNNKLVYAAAVDNDAIGVTAHAAFAADEPVTVILRTAQGTVEIEAHEAFATAGAACYAAANGRIATAGTVLVGVVCATASGAGAVVEVVQATTAVLGSTARTALTQQDLQPYPISPTTLRVWDAPSTVAPATGGNDDLGVYNNTFLTGAPTVETGDVKAGGAISRKIRFQFPVPVEYVAGETITLRLNAGMKTTVADTSATIDAEVVRAAVPNTDICATAAQSINNLVAADKDFTITPTNVVPGDILDCVITIATNDAATAGAVIGKLNSIAVLMDVKG
jgi:hypothetical protein